ncbi:MAG: Na/Pi cotransporter family protein [Tissierellia bacterium]|nr:Na/Pi cotransporter family protein [Tissierellia bacterium]
MTIILPLLGGLGLFIYGMNLMGDGLEKSAGDRLRSIIEKLTTNRLLGLLVGTLVTMVVQSSSATTVMVIGFVNAGIMNLNQAVGVIMGANIGTTVTGQLIALNLKDYAPIAVALGVFALVLAKNNHRKHRAQILVGFGILFIGLDMMSKGLAPLADKPWFSSFLLQLQNPLLATLAGFAMTTALQSSSASIGILQALASQGLIGLDLAFPILFGDNIGTTTTSLISSIGANTTAKRAALLHFIFNVIGTILFMAILRWPVQRLVLAISPSNSMRQIANAHTLFNLINVLIQLPFAHLLVNLVEKLIPLTEEDSQRELKYLDPRLLKTPSIAVNQVKKEVIHMAELAMENLRHAYSFLLDGDANTFDAITQLEGHINDLNEGITRFIVNLSNEALTPGENERLNMFLYIIDDLERIGDHILEMATLSQDKKSLHQGRFSPEAAKDLHYLLDKTLVILESALNCFRQVDPLLAQEVLAMEDEIDDLQIHFKNQHMDRLHHGICQVEGSMDFMEILNSLERIADHSRNIAYHIDDISRGKIQAITLENF